MKPKNNALTTPEKPHATSATRRTLPKGCRWTGSGIQVFAWVKGTFRSSHVAATTNNEDLKREWARLKYGESVVAPDGPAPEPAAVTAYFPADVERYLKLIGAMPTFAGRTFELKEWARALGAVPTSSITAEQISLVLERWRTEGREDGGGEGLAPGTLNKRRTALMSFFTRLYGKSGANPVRDVPLYDDGDSVQIRAHDPKLLYRLLARLGRKAWRSRRKRFQGGAPQRMSKTRARLRLILHTGWPQAQVMQLKPGDITWTKSREAATVARRKKGRRGNTGGVRMKTVPLFPEAVAALRGFAKADAWGPFSTSSMHSAVARAVADENAWRARHGKPPIGAVRPYDFRHTFGTEIAKTLTDERAIQELMLHATSAQTRRYTEAATSARLERARATILAAKEAESGKVLAKKLAKSRKVKKR